MTKVWRCEAGLSMVEALVALAILAIVSTPILSAFMVARAAQAEATGRTIAQSLARRTLENLQQTAFSNFDDATLAYEDAPGDTDGHKTVDSTTRPGYTITTTVTCVQSYTLAGDDCVLKNVQVDVSWIGAKRRELHHTLTTRLERRQ